MFEHRTAAAQAHHERRVASKLLAFRGANFQTLESRDPQHVDVHIVLNDGRQLDIEVTDATPQAALKSQHSHSYFDCELQSAVERLKPAVHVQFSDAFSDASIYVDFEDKPPSQKRSTRANDVVCWLLAHGAIKGNYEFDPSARDLWPYSMSRYAPPVAGIKHIGVFRGDTGYGPKFGPRRALVWDELDLIPAVIKQKLPKQYIACPDVELAVKVTFLPSEWAVSQLQSTLPPLSETPFVSIWLVADNGARQLM